MSEGSLPAPDSTTALAAMSEADRSHWRLTGEFPETPAAPDPSTPLPDSSPAEPAAQAASTEAQAPPASEPGTPTTRKSNADSRKAELKAEIDSLLAERARVRAELDAERFAARPVAPPTPPPAASSPAKADTPFPSFDQWFAADPARAQLADPYIEYLDVRAEAKATAVYEAKQRDATARQQQQAHQQQIETNQAQFQARYQAAMQADPEFKASLDPRWHQAVPVDLLPAGTVPNALNIVAQEVLMSEHGPAIMSHLSANPSEFDRLLSSTNAVSIVRAVGRLEASVSSVAPIAKVVSAGPAIGTTVGSRASGPTDEVAAAVARGDQRAYREAANARELAAARAAAPGPRR